MPFTHCQSKALSVLEGAHSVFLTGAAGTGKSFLLQQFLHDKNRQEYPILASTGAAAVIVEGRTFHSFFGLGILEGGKDATVARAIRSAPLHKRLQHARCIIIDEVSMLSGETLATAEEIARRVRNNDEPWGGLRIIAVGDFAQLPPVQPSAQEIDWAFLHPVWERSAFIPVYLETVVRTDDKELLHVLQDVRLGNMTDDVRLFLEHRTKASDALFDGTRLFPHRSSAHRYNMQRLENLPAPLHTFDTEYKGQKRAVEQLQKQCPIQEQLHLKKDALVMLRKNDMSFPYSYVNGTLGTVVHIDAYALTLRLMSGKTIEIEKEEFSLLDGDGSPKATAYNFPVTLAWATTIHKAQGASIDRLMVSLSHLWASGHAYVALSRVRSADGLSIEHWDERSIFVDPAVLEFMKAMQEQWRELSETLSVPATEIVTTKRPSSKKVPNHRKTLPLLQNKLPLVEIATLLAWKEETIIQHIEKLLLEREPIDICYLRPPEEQFEEIAGALATHGIHALKPVYSALDGRYSYKDLKLTKLFLEQEEGARF